MGINRQKQEADCLVEQPAAGVHRRAPPEPSAPARGLLDSGSGDTEGSRAGVRVDASIRISCRHFRQASWTFPTESAPLPATKAASCPPRVGSCSCSSSPHSGCSVCCSRTVPRRPRSLERWGKGKPPTPRAHFDASEDASAHPSPVIASNARVVTELPAVTSEVSLRGQVVQKEDGRPVAGCKVLLFLREVTETYERVSADELRPWTTWTDADGRFDLSFEAEPESEWRGALHAYYPGRRRAVFPIVRIEPNRDADVGQLELIEPPAPRAPLPPIDAAGNDRSHGAAATLTRALPYRDRRFPCIAPNAPGGLASARSGAAEATAEPVRGHPCRHWFPGRPGRLQALPDTLRRRRFVPPAARHDKLAPARLRLFGAVGARPRPAHRFRLATVAQPLACRDATSASRHVGAVHPEPRAVGSSRPFRAPKRRDVTATRRPRLDARPGRAARGRGRRSVLRPQLAD